MGNLSDLPDDLIQVIRRRLAGGPLPQQDDDFQIVRSLPHRHVAAGLGTLRKIGLDRILSAKPCRQAQLITSKRIDEDLQDAEGLDWITALRADSIKKLVSQQTSQLSLFDQQDLAEVTADDYPDERLIVCRNPLLAEERARKRNELLAAAAEKKPDAAVRAAS